MKLELFDIDEFILVNELKQIRSPVLFERGGVADPEGLISDVIFGINSASRRETFAYIDLKTHFFHPHIYKILKRVFRNIDKIINGEMYCSIDSNGQIVKDPSGETGMEFLYSNWKNIKWDIKSGMSGERTTLISKTKKNEIFVDKFVVIPAFYRDINSSSGSAGETPPINTMYTKLIRYAKLLDTKDMFDFTFHATNYNMQQTLVEIYDHFKDKLDKKSGLLRKYLLGKNVDYCTRTVISAPTFNAETIADNMVDFLHTGIPLAQACILVYPFMIQWLTNFFQRELVENKYTKLTFDTSSGEFGEMNIIKNPESFYNDTFIKKAVDKFVYNPASRYDKIPVPLENGKTSYLIFNGSETNEKGELAPISNRHMTWTDLLYIAACDITKDKHTMQTRYPLLDNFGLFITKIRILSTLKTKPVTINNTLYKWYPDIDPKMSVSDISNNFIDSTIFCISYLRGMDGDFDGDQTTSKIIWTDEANEECARYLNSLSTILSSNGKNTRILDLNGIQTLYALTKDPE